MKIPDREELPRTAIQHDDSIQNHEIIPVRTASGETVWQTPNARIVITPIRSYAENEKFLTESERNYLNTHYGNSHRRDEGSTWRAALRRHTACGDTCYTCDGAPCTVADEFHISVSHTSDKAAIIISDKRCGIDIEKCDRNFAKAAGRYMSPEESELTNSFGSAWQGVVWCAKECMYKMYGHRSVDFGHDMKILSASDNRLTCRVGTPATKPEIYSLSVLFIENHICVWGTV